MGKRYTRLFIYVLLCVLFTNVIMLLRMRADHVVRMRRTPSDVETGLSCDGVNVTGHSDVTATADCDIDGRQRLLNQLTLWTVGDAKVVDRSRSSSRRNKVIQLMYVDNNLRKDVTYLRDHCPVSECVIVMSDKWRAAQQADLVVFSGTGGDPVPSDLHMKRQMGNNQQLWGLFNIESPQNTGYINGFKESFNWTLTYRLDSTIATPYFLWRDSQKLKYLPAISKKTSQGAKIAWFVSNCDTNNQRAAYVIELQKYIDVDIYGACGTKQCGREKEAECDVMLRHNYFFYLAFENSNCIGYITEKALRAYKNDVIPVVMGARRQDYEAICPPDSFIHVDDFPSPRQLARYLRRVAEDPGLFQAYFQWKGRGSFVDGYFWCRVCAMLHDEKKPHISVRDIDRWWHRPGVCVGGGWPGSRRALHNTTTAPLTARAP